MQLNELVKSTRNNVVAVEPGESSAIIFLREHNCLNQEELPFRPFLLLQSPLMLNGCESDFDIVALNGTAPLSYLATFSNVKEYQQTVSFVKQTTGYRQTSANAPFRVISDLTQQVLMQHQLRLFRGMTFDGVRRLQFDLETLVESGFEFPNPHRPEDQIVIISMSDNTGWEQVISQDGMTEKELLEKFVATIKERDPDIIEGHNIFRFDLPYLEARAKLNRVKLLLGRNNSPPKKRNSRFSAAERTINYTRYDIFGRQVVDTFHLAIFYDITHRNLESYGLKYIAKHFGVAAPQRTYVEGGEITRLWHEDRQRLLAYALDDVRETRAISEILSPSYFYQAQLAPMKYQDCVVRGNATRIDALLVADYLAGGNSLPFPEPTRPFTGALTKAFEAGVFKNVWHCDVRSLYPSIIIAEKWCPTRDEQGVFSRFLRELRKFRLDARRAEGQASDPADKAYSHSLQTTFKILINSFYGYLGFAQGTFNDYAMAERVTGRGREILTLMLDFLNDAGSTVIEMDTDGIYFQPPPDVTAPSEMEKQIQNVLPAGIEVEIDAVYQAMFCYKSKNYALREESGEIIITGAALKSRGIEPFQRDFMAELMELLLDENYAAINELREKYRKAIATHKMPVERLAKTETLSASLDSYQRKLASGSGRRSAAYELAIASGRDYRQGDQVSFYITGDKKRLSVVENSKLLVDASEPPDENVAYYLNKLDELYKKFEPFIPSAFRQDMLL